MTPILHDIAQGTEEWHRLRCGLLTASEMGRLLTPKGGKPSRGQDAESLLLEKAAQRVTRMVDVQKPSFNFERGHDDEAEARNLYSAHIAPVTEMGFITCVFESVTLGYSPDGLVGRDGLIECKSRAQKYQMDTIIRQEVPSEHMAQLQTGLLVSGREWIDYLSFPACGGGKMIVIRVRLDHAYATRLLEVAYEAEEKINALVKRYHEALQSGKARFFDTERRDDGEPTTVEFTV